MKSIWALGLLLTTACSPSFEQACKQLCDKGQECDGTVAEEELEACKNDCEAGAVYAEAESSPDCIGAAADWMSCTGGMSCAELASTGSGSGSDCAADYATAEVQCQDDTGTIGVTSTWSPGGSFGGSVCDQAAYTLEACPGYVGEDEVKGEGPAPSHYCGPGTYEACFSECIVDNPYSVCGMLEEDVDDERVQDFSECASKCYLEDPIETSDSCCTADDACNFANDGACDCNGEQVWDAADCGPSDDVDPCCTSHNQCDWANDGFCDCDGEQSWDAADCGL